MHVAVIDLVNLVRETRVFAHALAVGLDRLSHQVPAELKPEVDLLRGTASHLRDHIVQAEAEGAEQMPPQMPPKGP